MMTLGWFWFWIGMNAVRAVPDGGYLPLPLGARTVLAHIAGSLLLVVYWCIGYALDEQDDKTAVVLEEGSVASEQSQTIFAFGQAGYVGGSIWEIKVLMLVPWLIYAIATLIPLYRVGPVLTTTCMVLVIQGVLVGQYLEHFHRKQLESVKTWGRQMVIGFFALVVLLSFKGWIPALLAFSSLVLLAFGYKIMDKDRKYGYEWLVSGRINENVTVYSFGIPLITLGIIFLSWSISL